ncbi:hypothetical protein StoSoilB22_13200 [Arthrobacter sp. StoSoilB22]|nr:hypothetical protein StoSoilB22_13200 [Arthrobacter sp. StoSoilB22]
MEREKTLLELLESGSGAAGWLDGWGTGAPQEWSGIRGTAKEPPTRLPGTPLPILPN